MCIICISLELVNTMRERTKILQTFFTRFQIFGKFILSINCIDFSIFDSFGIKFKANEKVWNDLHHVQHKSNCVLQFMIWFVFFLRFRCFCVCVSIFLFVFVIFRFLYLVSNERACVASIQEMLVCMCQINKQTLPFP